MARSPGKTEPLSTFEAAVERLALALGPAEPTREGWPRARAQLARYAALAAEWNRHLDLTAADGAEAIVEVLAADAFVLSRRGEEALVEEGEAVLDVGSGAGGPALALAILREDVSLALLEPKNKRVAFLRSVIGQLELAGRVSAHEGRIDVRAPSVPDAVARALPTPTLASARATFEPPIWAEVGLALAPSALLYLSREEPPEGSLITRDVRYTLPLRGSARRIVRVAAAAR